MLRLWVCIIIVDESECVLLMAAARDSGASETGGTEATTVRRS